MGLPPRNSGRLSLENLNSLSTDPLSSVTIFKTTIHLAISPTWLTNLKTGVDNELTPYLNRYYPPLKAILLGYDNLKLSSRIGTLVYDSPAIHINVGADFFLFSPEIGSKIPGVVNKRSHGHLGCLVHDTFNVSLPAGVSEQGVIIGQEVTMEVTKVIWGHKNMMPIIQGKLVDASQQEQEIDFDSGIDSTIAVKEEEVEVKKVKKNKKRKKDNEENTAEVESQDCQPSPKKKKKKKKDQ